MSKMLIITASIMLAIWAVGLFIYDMGINIHFTLLLAVVLIIIRVIREK
ncbi:lmo0937 family membrane protein [Arenibacter aquaticus]|uniref:Lmo0937 family membrane protein n=1 Tax=Arenibacter aquaticus TaxID=2489054 RepID=A0A430K323_9FLAO|nr:lmo0937 family membrane protein [Arenibacter aquaticus]